MNGGRAFLLDFDHTLFDTDRFFWVDVRAAFSRFAIDAGAWEEAYARVWPTGYSLEKHLRDLVRTGQMRDGDAAAVERLLRERFTDLHGYLFADVGPFLRRLQTESIPCFLLSFGDAGWQAFKVRGTGIADFFQDIFYTGREEAKAEVIAPFLERYKRLAVVDNDPRELDLIKGRHPRVETYWITRLPPEALMSSNPEIEQRFREARHYATLSARLAHHRCTTLDEVPL